MAVVNKFNVNKEQVTLDADIIENMSANDVSYNSSLQYDENTIGNKLSELEKEVIYDVTANNDGVTFASLSTLLSDENLSTLIPPTVKCGGMSIRFVQSSDNKYVQYRLMAQTFSILVADWQGIDDESTAGSDNLIKSGGVYNSIKDLILGNPGVTISGTKIQFAKPGRYVNGVYKDESPYKVTELMPIFEGDSISAYLGSSGSLNTDAISYFDKDRHPLSSIKMTSSVILSTYESTAPRGAYYVAFTHFNSGGFIDKETYSIVYDYYSLEKIKVLLSQMQDNLSAIDGGGKFAYTEMFTPFDSYSVIQDRFITSDGVQGNATWCNLYSFNTEVNRIYAIKGTAGNTTLVLAYYQGTGIVNEYDGKLTFVVGDGSKIYINSKADTLEVYEFIMAGSSSDVAIPHEVNILQTFDNIVCCGDSLTYGAVYYSDTAKQALSPYPKCLEKLTGCSVSSLASGGYSAKDWWDNYNEQISGANKLYIIYLGTNGYLTDTVDTDCDGDDYTLYADTNTGNYGKIIKKMLDSRSMVLLIGIESMESSSNYIDTIKAVKSLAIRFNVPIVRNPAVYLSDNYYHYAPGTTSYNSIHMNNLGYAKFASILINTINNLPLSEQFKLQPIQSHQ